MNLLGKYLIILTLYYSLLQVSSQTRKPDKKNEYSFHIKSDWEKVEEGWPLEDFEDSISGRRTQYLFNKKFNLNRFSLAINNSILQKLPGNSDYFKLSFKFWFKKDESSSGVLLNYGKIKDELSSRYISDFKGKWMPCSYVLSYYDLISFNITLTLLSENPIAAFKDFKIEYRVSQSPKIDTPTKSKSEDAQLKNWNTYIHPKGDAGKNHDFLYFPNNGQKYYTLNSVGLRLPNEKTRNVTKITVGFEYWITGTKGTEIELLKGNPKTITKRNDDWEFTEIQSDELDYKKIIIKVNIAAKTREFVAIKNLKLTVHFNDTIDKKPKNHTFECRDYENCQWKGIEESSWFKLKYNLLENGTYYYPTSPDNSITFHRNEDLRNESLCFSIEFGATNKKITKLNVYYAIPQGSIKKLMLSLRPNVFSAQNELEEYKICIRDFIALNMKKYSIIFSVKQPNIIGNINDFVLRINEVKADKTKWDFAAKTQNFLQSMKRPNPLNKWNDEWMVVSPTSPSLFDLTRENHVSFSAEHENEIPASAILLSKNWLINSKDLRSVESRYSVEANDFKNFNIIPRVCDWLSQCFDVKQVMERQSDNKNIRYFTFNYLNLAYSPQIKLSFYIEYYGKASVTFNLTLEHFGDPCTRIRPDCESCNYCETNLTRVPNEKCECEPKNPCDEPYNRTSTRAQYCLDKRLDCEDFAGSFRCVCEKDSLVNWNPQNNSCNKPEINSVNKSWVEDTADKTFFYPNATDNKFALNFMNINNETHDVCLTLNIKSTQSSIFIVNYSDAKISKLFDLNLSKQDKNINFCVRDFRYEYSSNFDLIFAVKINKTTKESFRIKLESIDIKTIDVKSLKYIGNWDHFNQKQNWRFIPDFFHENSVSDNFSIEFKAQEFLTALLISDWIEDGQGLETLSYFTAKYSKDIENIFTIKQRILIMKDNEYSEDTTALATVNKTETTTIFGINKLKGIKTPFKIILEITKLKDDKKVVLINFESFSVGDPCFIMNETTFIRDPVCKGNSICKSLGPNKHICEKCNSTAWSGPNCSFQNKCDQPFADSKMKRNDICRSTPSLPIEDLCEMISNDGFSCQCFGDYQWDQKSQRCLNKDVTESEFVGCNEKECFIDSVLTNMTWSNKNLLQSEIDQSERKNLDIYRPKNSKSEVVIQIMKLDQNHDVCLLLSYKMSKNVELYIKINETKSFTLRSDLKTNDISTKGLEFENEKFCIRNLYKKMNDNFNIKLSPKFNDTDDYNLIVKLNRSIAQSECRYCSKLSQNLKFLTHWHSIDDKTKNDINFTRSNQWPMMFPTDENKQINGETRVYWTIEENDIIKFQVNDKIPGIRQAYLISNWLKNDIKIRDFQFKLTTSTGNLENFFLKVVLFNDTMDENGLSNEIFGDKYMNEKAQDNRTLVYKIPVIKNSFRIGIKVDYRKPLLSSNCNFMLSYLSFGDPCIDETLNFRQCNQKPNENYIFDKCTRNESMEYKCNCDQIQTLGKNCEIKDYCKKETIPGTSKIGNDICEKKNGENTCKNTDDGRKIECICDHGSYWNKNLNNSKCLIFPKCISHKCDSTTEKCVEPLTIAGEPECVCDEAKFYYNSTGKCEKIDICSKDYRTHKSWSNEICQESNATCVSLGYGENDYMCLCRAGFRNSETDLKKCESIACSLPSLNKCEQICEPNLNEPDGYECKCFPEYEKKNDKCHMKNDKKCPCKDGSYCDSNDCVCRDHFRKNKNGSKVIGCEPDESVLNKACPDGFLNLTAKNELACFCGDKYQLNDKNTCDLRPICGKDGIGRKVCNDKKALCLTDIYSEGSFTCSCPSDKQFYADTPDKVCVDKCSLFNRENICSNMNAECYPSEIKEIYGDITSKTIYCKCKPGFVMGPEKCLLAKYAKEFSITFKDTFANLVNRELLRPDRDEKKVLKKSLFDAQKLIKDLESMRIENSILENDAKNKMKVFILKNFLAQKIRSIISNVNKESNSLVLESCDSKPGDFYDCKFVLTLKKSSDEYSKIIKTELNSQCISTNQTNDLCFFQTTSNYYDDDGTGQKIWVDQQKLSKISLVNYEPCHNSRKAKTCPEYSICTPENNTTRFRCKCDPIYFSVSDEVEIALESTSTEPNVKLFKEKCKLREDICSLCPDSKNMRCIKTNPEQDANGNWKAEPNCTCHEPDYHYSETKKQCTAVCDNDKCKHGTCKAKGSFGYSCECLQGWSGENCDKEYTLSSGGWIAGIVVLAVLLVVASGIAFIFARRARNAGVRNSNHPMDDFSGQSYRVGQTGSAGARGQSVFQGRENPSFHRD